MCVITAPRVNIIITFYSQLSPSSPCCGGNSGSESTRSLCTPATPTGWYLETTISLVSTCCNSFFSHGVPLHSTTPILWWWSGIDWRLETEKMWYDMLIGCYHGNKSTLRSLLHWPQAPRVPLLEMLVFFEWMEFSTNSTDKMVLGTLVVLPS